VCHAHRLAADGEACAAVAVAARRWVQRVFFAQLGATVIIAATSAPPQACHNASSHTQQVQVRGATAVALIGTAQLIRPSLSPTLFGSA
jgi:hypothetical protein